MRFIRPIPLRFDESPRFYVNRTGYIPCWNCNLVIWKQRKNIYHTDGSVMNPDEFKGVNGFSDPVYGTYLFCPKCGNRIILKDK